MSSTTIIRGFKVSVETFDAFLRANNIDETEGIPPFYEHHPDQDPMSKLLFSKIYQHDPSADRNKFRVLLPHIEGQGRTQTAYVAYAWAAVRAHREVRLQEDLPEEIPRGFEELRQEILGYGEEEGERVAGEGKLGIYLVVTFGIRGYYGEDMHSSEC
ncbi:hypothetical protein QBC35DRAFT_36305 [Podospora australis]|uniref:Uncharacterized protein n=1 Tax=Podospora australis TaxID=1536484 RepID=A0AAN6WZE1_9PEZI|nr:hypothetical protein QBC35DRAFT_36305 [Podospora australis]